MDTYNLNHNKDLLNVPIVCKQIKECVFQTIGTCILYSPTVQCVFPPCSFNINPFTCKDFESPDVYKNRYFLNNQIIERKKNNYYAIVNCVVSLHNSC